MQRRSCLSACLLTGCVAWAQAATRAVAAAAGPVPPVDDETATHFLPLFPLGIVVFPGEIVPLHIFEPRYKQLIAECDELGISFGIVTVVPGGASSIGTEMKLDSILRKHDNGNLDIATRGIRTFELKSIQPVVEGKLYSGGNVSFISNDSRVDPEIQNALVELYKRMQRLAGSNRNLAPPYPENLSFVIGHQVGLSGAQELQLLTMPAEQDRQVYLLQHLARSL